MSPPDGNPIDILCIVMALLATLVRLLRMLGARHDRELTLDVARLITDASCAATIPPWLWMIGAVDSITRLSGQSPQRCIGA